MATPGPVVVGTDGTVHCDPALRFAADEARQRGVELVVVLAFLGPIDPDVDDFETDRSIQVARHARIATDALARALHSPVADLPAHRVVCDDLEPAALLLRASAGAGLLVVGHRHRGVAERLVHGRSRIGKLARRCPVPVVIVPDHDPPPSR